MFFFHRVCPLQTVKNRRKPWKNRHQTVNKSAPKIHHFFTVSFSPFTSSWFYFPELIRLGVIYYAGKSLPRGGEVLALSSTDRKCLHVAGRDSDLPRASGNSVDFPEIHQTSREVPLSQCKKSIHHHCGTLFSHSGVYHFLAKTREKGIHHGSRKKGIHHRGLRPWKSKKKK